MFHDVASIERSERNVFYVAIDECAGHKRVVVPLDYELQIDMRVVLMEFLELGRPQQLPDAVGGGSPITEEDT